MTGAPDTLQRLLERARAFPAAGLRLTDAAERESFLAWPEIAARAAAAAGRLAAVGVAPGERVALVYPTGADFFEAFFGVLAAGAVPVPLYPPVRLGRLAEYEERTAAMLAAAGAVLVLTDTRLSGLVGRAVERARPRLGGATLGALPEAPPRFVAGAAADLALVQFSSGTTVDPRPVALTQAAVLAQTRALTALWPDSAQVTHSGVSWLPLYHDMGLIGCVLPALERPGVLTLLPPQGFVARPALWLRAIARHRATISVAPNFAYALATERIRDEELEGCDLGGWSEALCGAETVSAATLRAFAERFARWGFSARALRPVYGLSEAALAVTFAPAGRGVTSLRVEREALARGEVREAARGSEIVSLGAPLGGFAVELRDEAGRALAEDRVGRVFVAGPSLMREYLGRPEQTASALAGGWLDTGDLGFRHGGDLYLTGRAKDVLILRGLNHSPADVEAATAEVAGVRRGCAVAASHREPGAATDRLLLFVEHCRGLTASARARLPRRCRDAVLGATGLAVDEVIVLAPGTLPRTSSGKLRRAETLVRHLDGRLDAPAPAGRLRLALAWLAGRRALARAAPR